MNRIEAKEFYPILQDYAEGKVIECRTKPSALEGTDVPNDWAKWIMEILASKTQEDGVDAELPDIEALIKECTSDEFIEKKIKDILGDQASKDE